MEPEIVSVQITTTMSNLHQTLGFPSAVEIHLHDVVQELIEDVTGRTHVACSRVLLRPHSFHLDELSHLIRLRLNRQAAPFCYYLAQAIASRRSSSPYCQRPFLMSVNLIVVREIRFILSSVSVLSPGASVDVFQRLLEEQSVEPVDLGETCSICFEDFSGPPPSSESTHQNSIIQMPKCLHSFHQNCIFQWLARHNSCPLCRRVPYEEDQDH